MDAKKLATATLDDIVFENRHKAYGAYDLRKSYTKTVWRAFFIGSLSYVVGVAGPFIASKFFVGQDKKEEIAVEVDLSKLEEQKKEEEKIELPPPPPPEEIKKPEVAQVAFPPPEPKPDEQVIEETPPPKVEEIQDKVISNQNVEGEKSDGLIEDTPPPAEEPVIAKPAEVEKPREEEIFTTVEQTAEFPGGTRELYKFLRDNMKYPAAAQRANVSGKVFLQFVVNTDGSIVDIQPLKGIGFGCDEEAIRVVKEMPKWTPGKQNGRNVRQRYTLPIAFVLE
jgi:periplasmic protein TonB